MMCMTITTIGASEDENNRNKYLEDGELELQALLIKSFET